MIRESLCALLGWFCLGSNLCQIDFVGSDKSKIDIGNIAFQAIKADLGYSFFSEDVTVSEHSPERNNANPFKVTKFNAKLDGRPGRWSGVTLEGKRKITIDDFYGFSIGIPVSGNRNIINLSRSLPIVADLKQDDILPIWRPVVFSDFSFVYAYIGPQLLFRSALRGFSKTNGGVGISTSNLQRTISVFSGIARNFDGFASVIERGQKTQEPEDSYPKTSHSPFSRFFGGVRSLPLGAKIGIAIVPALPAWPLIFGGLDSFDGFGGVRRDRWRALWLWLCGFSLLGLSCLFWWFIGPY